MNKLETGAQNRPFCIATRPRAGRSRNGVRLVADARDFYLLHSGFWVHPTSYPMILRAVSPGKAADHSPPPSTNVECMELYLHSPYVFICNTYVSVGKTYLYVYKPQLKVQSGKYEFWVTALESHPTCLKRNTDKVGWGGDTVVEPRN
jgi:hypothetical protein